MKTFKVYYTKFSNHEWTSYRREMYFKAEDREKVREYIKSFNNYDYEYCVDIIAEIEIDKIPSDVVVKEI